MTGTVTATRRLAVVAYDALGLGDRSYLLHDGNKAFVVDPLRDPHPYLATAKDLGVDITLVLETHVHNDYVSGGLALARKAGATYGVPGGVAFEFSSEGSALEEGDLLHVGELSVRVLSTPGHTPQHLAFQAWDAQGTKVVLTGGSLLSGSTGRTDLFGREQAKSLAEAQWGSVRRLLRELDPSTAVLPTHGFGSFCSARPSTAAGSDQLTVGAERQHNPAARLDLNAFVEDLLSNLLPIPAYYRHMAPLNLAGAAEPRYGPVPVLAPDAWPEWASKGTLVDLRPRRRFAEAHLRGVLNLELGVNLPTYLGWVVPYTAPFVIVSESFDDVEEGRRLLSRIGREVLVGWAQADFVELLPAAKLGRYEVAAFRELAQRYREAPPPTYLTCASLTNGNKGTSGGRRTCRSPKLLR